MNGSRGVALVLTSGAGTTDTRVDPEIVGLLEEALDALGDDRPEIRARLLSSLAVELQWGPEVERRMRLAREALELARETRDPVALSLVATRSWALVDGSRPMVDEMEALTDEATLAARTSGDPGALSGNLRSRAVIAACRGDGAAFAANMGEAARVNSTLRRPHLNWVARNDEAAVAAYVGDLDRAEQLATEALELRASTTVTDEAAIGVFGSILYQVRTAQGRVAELIPLLEARVSGAPDITAWRVALAGALLESDRLDEARGAPPLARGRRVRQGGARCRVSRHHVRARAADVPAADCRGDHTRRIPASASVRGSVQLERRVHE